MDALLVSLSVHVRYLAGYRSPFWGDLPDGPLALIPGDERVALGLVLPPALASTATGTWIGDVRVAAGPEEEGLVAAAAELLRERGLERATIGLDLGTAARENLSAAGFRRLEAALPGARLVDAGPLMAGLRSIKSAAEVAALERAGALTCAAWSAGLDALRPGMSKRELAAAIGAALFAAGGEAGSPRPWLLYLAAGREMATWVNLTVDDYRLAAGDLAIVDGGATWRGYHCDICHRRSGLPSPASRVPGRAPGTDPTPGCRPGG